MKFFYLQRHRVRLSAVIAVNSVEPVGNRAGNYTFDVVTAGGWTMSPQYPDEPTAVAVRAELMKELDRDAASG